MIFNEARFFVFLAIVLAVYWALRRDGQRKTWLLFTSCIFYGAWSTKFLALMLGTALFDYGAGLLLTRWTDPRRRRAVVATSLIVNLGVLGFFKYWGFFVGAAADLLLSLGFQPNLPVLHVVLPVGISFYTFQSLSYTLDVGRGAIPAVRSARDFLLFVTFFPQLVAGPIVRAIDFLPQLTSIRTIDRVKFRACAVLFLVGFAKKTCIADRVAGTVDAVFQDVGRHGAADLWTAACLYAVQIYCDFSGYSDMAIATAGAFGYTLTRNFNFPYLAQSVTDFWRRWHISLSTWFRDYLYIPLGGNRLGTARTCLNLALVFLLCGLWHGAAWTFIIWGLWHGAFLLIERAGGERLLESAPVPLRTVWSLGAVVLGWVWFRSASATDAATAFAGLFGAAAGPAVRSVSPVWWVLIAALAVTHFAASRGRLVSARLATLPLPSFAVLYGVTWALVLFCAAIGNRAFIYFQF
ncbi:MAG: MBOAT family protein [Planctomycetes bacterium]|nr:MBOAT family protein [Planctomycetota bacterium]